MKKKAVIFLSLIIIAAVFYSACELGGYGAGWSRPAEPKSGPRGNYRPLAHHTEGISEIIAAPDLLVSCGSKDKKVIFTRLSQSEKPIQPGVIQAQVEKMALSINKNQLATIDDQGKEITFWDTTNYSKISSLTANTKLTSLSYNNDGSLIVAGHEDGTIKILELPSGKTLRQFQIPKESVSQILKEPPGKLKAVAISPANNYVAGVDANGTVLVWNTIGEEKGNILIAPPNSFSSIEFSPDSKYLLASGNSMSISITIGSDGDTSLKITSQSGVVLVYDLQNGKSSQVNSNTEVFENAFWYKSGQVIIQSAKFSTGGFTKKLRIYPLNDILNGKLVNKSSEIVYGFGPVYSNSDFDYDNSIFAAEFNDTVYIWKIGEPVTSSKPEEKQP